jgi:glycosyltransferase involved in cell wall biosynthesis
MLAGLSNEFPKVLIRKFMERMKLTLLPLICFFKRSVKVDSWPAEKPLISVIIPCYNHGHYLSEAVESVLAQIWQNLEIIIVNDGSTDKNTISVLKTFTKPKTQILHHTENRGLPAARNTGIRQAQGKYIFCLDADDKIHPTYLEKAMLVMEGNIEVGFAYSFVQVFGDEERVWECPQFDASVLIDSIQLTALGVFRRSAWEQVGGYREEMRLGYEDWEFWIRLTRHGYRGYRIPEKLVFVRRIGSSFVHAAMSKHDQLKADIERYNPDVYEDRSWLNHLKRPQDDPVVGNPLVNLHNDNAILPYQNPILWINEDVSELFRKELPSLLQKIQAHQGDFVILSYKWLDGDITDSLYSLTPYIYILPNYLPPCAWKKFVQMKQSMK